MCHSKISFPNCRKIRFWEHFKNFPRELERFGPLALNFTGCPSTSKVNENSVIVLFKDSKHVL